MSKVSELLVEATILALLFCCSLLHCKSVMSGFLSTWVGLLSNGVGLFFMREGSQKYTHPPL